MLQRFCNYGLFTHPAGSSTMIIAQRPLNLFANPTTSLQMRGFAAQHEQEKEAVKLPELHSIRDLEALGYQNLAQTKENGLNYDKIIGENIEETAALAGHPHTFTSFEEQINAQFQLKPTLPTSRNSKRTGVIGYKIGMTHFWDKWGKLTPCTVIQLDRCQVTQVKTKAKDGVNAIQVGCGEKKVQRIKKPQIGHFLKHNLPPKRHLREFPVSPEAFLPVGYMLGPRHFQIGQAVDVCSVSIGKGTAGTIKRWNFAQQYNSHGNSRAHRLPGSIGQCEFPGKVIKGKKMAGQLGNQSATVMSQKVVKIDTDRSLLYIMGNVPGPIHSLVKVRDGVKKIDRQVFDLQWPTCLPGQGKDPKKEAKYQTWEGSAEDPWTNDYHENDVVSGKDQDED